MSIPIKVTTTSTSNNVVTTQTPSFRVSSTGAEPREFGQLVDVNLTGVADKDLITYDAASGTYIPVERSRFVETVSGIGTFLGVGIQSGGFVVGTAVTTLNFIGVGNTFSVDGDTVNISISGNGGETYWGESTLGIHTLSNVGIGTTDPQETLDVYGDVNVSGILSASSFYGDGTNLAIPKFFVVGVRVGAAITVSVFSGFLPILNRNGESTLVSLTF